MDGSATGAEIIVREARPADVTAILAITNYAILRTTANWNLAPMTLPARTAWFEERRGAGFPVLVAEREGAVCGFASYGPFRPYEAYAHTVEHAIYVAPAAQRSGVGSALLSGLIARADAAGLHVMVAAIEARNEASLALHARFGFVRVGLMPEVGRKFGHWLDLALLQKTLPGGSAPG